MTKSLLALTCLALLALPACKRREERKSMRRPAGEPVEYVEADMMEEEMMVPAKQAPKPAKKAAAVKAVNGMDLKPEPAKMIDVPKEPVDMGARAARMGMPMTQ